MTDEEAMNVHLDAHPEDVATRAVLSDLLLDLGRDDEAAGQRWLIATERWPTHRHELARIGLPWDWWPPHFPLCRSHATMPEDFFASESSSGYEGRHRTRTEAETTAIAYARRNGLLEGA